MYFNPEMASTYQNNINKYTGYFTNVVRNIDIYLQEDQLMRTKCEFPLVPVPTYLPTGKELTQSSVCHIEDAVNWEVKTVEWEMLTIMEGRQDDNPPWIV